MKKYQFAFVFLIIVLLLGSKLNKSKKYYTLQNILIDYEFISANEVKMWVANNGEGSYDPASDGSGYFWPGGRSASQTAIYDDGLIWGGLIDSMPRANGSLYRQGTLAGAILNDGTADDPNSDRNRIYKIRKDWESLPDGDEKSRYERDYYEWPAERGAPYVDVDGDGKFTRGIDKPDFIGDEVLWWVMNDLDTTTSRFTLGADPIGMEIQVTVWAFTKSHLLGDVVFKKYKIINKSNNIVKDMYLGYWSDVDLGGANDDYVGCDTTLSLGYAYNAFATDDIYKDSVPAVGYQFLETPVVKAEADDTAIVEGRKKPGKKNLPMTAFMLYIGGSAIYSDPYLGNIKGSYNIYNNLKGKLWDGSSCVDPNTGDTTRYPLAGDPVNGTGWYEGNGWPDGPRPSDRRILLSTGGFDFVPGDTQNVVIAIPIAFKENNIQSLAFLKDRCERLQKMYARSMIFRPEPPGVNINITKEGGMIYWDEEVENKLYTNLNAQHEGSDSLYKFEGYRLYQYDDEKGNSPFPVYTTDKLNDISQLYYIYSGDDFPIVEMGIDLNNDGLRRYFKITKDYKHNLPLRIAGEYYFGVTSIFISKTISMKVGAGVKMLPEYVESKPRILNFVPSRKSIDNNNWYNTNQVLFGEHKSGAGDGYVSMKVIDPAKLKGENYKIIFNGMLDTLRYSMIYEPTQDTLIWMSDRMARVKRESWNRINFSWQDSISAPIVDGFQFWIRDLGNDSIQIAKTRYRVKDVVELKSDNKQNSVWNKSSSNGAWMVVAKGPNNRFNWQYAMQDAIGYKDYEIRFTDSSQYYLNGYGSTDYSLSPFSNDDLASDKLPFQIWDIGRTPNDKSDDKRLAIKILDNSSWDSSLTVSDRKWSRLPDGDWEEIYAFEPLGWSADTSDYPAKSGLTTFSNQKFGGFVIRGELPAPGTIIRLITWKPLSPEDTFVVNLPPINLNDKEHAKSLIDEITAFPNPFYGIKAAAENDINITFTNLPEEVIIRIFSLSGSLVRKLYKKEMNPFIKWNLRNENGLQVASGIYIAYVEMPGIGEKIMKLAVVF